jgi:hypothetical protein
MLAVGMSGPFGGITGFVMREEVMSERPVGFFEHDLIESVLVGEVEKGSEEVDIDAVGIVARDGDDHEKRGGGSCGDAEALDLGLGGLDAIVRQESRRVGDYESQVGRIDGLKPEKERGTA